jgi:signal peptidase II
MIWVITAAVICLDHLTKYWAVLALSRRGPIVLIENVLQLQYAENTGGAASIMADHPQLLTVLSLAALAIIIWWARTVPATEKLTRIGFAFVLGGAIGNLLDRIFRGGFLFKTYVVDFIDAHWHEYHWPTFNVADSAICVGIGVIFLAHFLTYRRSTQAGQPAEALKAPESPGRAPQ